MTASPRFRLFALALLFALLPATLLGTPEARAQDEVSIAEARERGVGATVTVDGTVTRAFGDFVRIQDESGATGASALVIRQTEGGFYDDIQDETIQAGTELTVTGTISAFNGLLQINEDDLTDYSVNGQGTPPAPQTVTLGELRNNGGDYVSELVRVEGLRFETPSTLFAEDQSYDVTDGTTTLTLRVQGADETNVIGTPVPGESFTYTGVASIFFPTRFNNPSYQLIPVGNGDFGLPRVGFGQRYALAYEEGGDASASFLVRAAGLPEGETITVTLSVAEEGTADASDLGGSVEQQLTLSGQEAQTVSLSAASDGDEEGVEHLEVQISGGNDFLPGIRYTFWILDDPTAQTTLYADLTGSELLSRLREDFASSNGSAGPPTLGYDVARDTLYRVVYNEGGEVCGLYTNFCLELPPPGEDPSSAIFMDGEGISAEHTWPQSQGAGDEPALSNMHILAPAHHPVNMARSNYPFNDIPDEDTEQWFFEDQSQPTIPSDNIDAWSELVESGSGDFFEPREAVKGNAARAVFYYVMAYPSGVNDFSFFAEQRDALRAWNAQDPVDATEQRRNVLVASYQGDELNPFQLDSTLVRRAFFEGGGDDGVLTINEARSRVNGTTVTVEGVVTRVEGRNVRIQDESGPTGASGLVVRYQDLADAIENGDVRPGDRLRVTGPLDDYVELKQINNQSSEGDVSYEIAEENAGLPAIQEVGVRDLATNGENYESELVRVGAFSIDAGGDANFQGGGPDGNYTATDADGNAITLRIPGETFYVGAAIPEGEVAFEGVVGQFGTDDPANGYQLQAIAVRDLLALPGETLALDISRAFGDPEASTGYRLVALPGSVDRPLDETIDGANGDAWQAFWDDGSEENFFIEWNDSETFDFEPGRGFWLISLDAWTVDDAVPVVGRDIVDASTSIGLHEGWNIISNPRAQDLSWEEVQEANGGQPLQPLWRYGSEGFAVQMGAFPAATSGEAFYFFNGAGDQEPLNRLVLPAPQEDAAAIASSVASGTSMSDATLTLTAFRGGRRASTVYVGTAAGAEEALDPHDALAPPARFEAASLYMPAGNASSQGESRQQRLAIERRAPGQDSYAFDLVLRAEGEEPVELRAGNLAAFGDGPVRLVETATGTEHDLRAERQVMLTPSGSETALRLLVGDASAERAEGPDEVTLRAGYPNPFREGVTFEYALPQEAQVRVTVYDLLGRRVRVLSEGRQEAGPHTLRWDGQGAGGAPMASGVYFVRLEAGDTVRSAKVVRVK